MNLLPTLAFGAAALLIAKKLTEKPYELTGKVVLITGGSRGLGLVLARQLAAEGAKLALCARSEEELREAQAEFDAQGVPCVTFVADVASEADARRVVHDTALHYGRLDVLINNAGIITVGPIETMTLKDYHDAMNVNFFGALHFMLAVRDVMKAQGGGRIVNVASIGGKVAVPHLVPYSASKFALSGLSKGWRAELAKDGIVVTTVHPGLISTGSPRNADFKGQHELEYAWFAVADNLPGLAQKVEDCARETIAALKAGRADVVTSVPGKVLAFLGSVLPGVTADANALQNLLLPKPGGVGTEKRKGFESESGLTQKLPRKQRAEVANNEL